MIKRNVCIVGLVALVPAASFAGSPLSQLQARTSLIFGDATVDHEHGGIWVGGNLTQVGSNDMGNEFVNGGGQDVLRVGKNLSWNNGNSSAVKNGNVRIGGAITNQTPGVDAGYHLYGPGAAVTIPAKTGFEQLSAALSGVAGTQLTNISNPNENQYDNNNAKLGSHNALNYKKSGGSNVYVFDVTNVLPNVHNFEFQNDFASTDSIILDVNLAKGQSLNLNGFNVNLGGLKTSQILWNFHVASGTAGLSWNNQFAGSVLAPDVNVSFSNNLMGQLVANSLTMSNGSEIHATNNGSTTDFGGNTGTIQAVPEPMTMGLLAAGVGAFIRRRKLAAK